LEKLLKDIPICVRGLEAKIAQIRNAAKSVAMEEEYNKKVTDEDIVRILVS
jgi:ATP-dependent Lon protease